MHSQQRIPGKKGEDNVGIVDFVDMTSIQILEDNTSRMTFRVLCVRNGWSGGTEEAMTWQLKSWIDKSQKS